MDVHFIQLVRRFLTGVVPQAARELRRIKTRAAAIEDDDIRREALSSISRKDFHVHGGCILATFLPRPKVRHYVRLVAVYETAVDYLDNLCDRIGSQDEADFRQLHRALLDAIDPQATPCEYFSLRAHDDGGYLRALVTESQQLFAGLPGYERVQPFVRQVTQRYCELQALKHLAPGERERRCAQAFAQVAPRLSWWEGAAACGSTMPTFALAFGASSACDERSARELYETYFPHISAFHILLDYFIDQAEDSAHGELNFAACYPSRQAMREGIAAIGRAALDAAAASAHSAEHTFAVRAMCGFYCSRAKVAQQGFEHDARVIAQAVGVDGVGGGWSPTTNPLLAPLLRLYRVMTRV